MHRRIRARHRLASRRGVVATEVVMWITIVALALTVGIATVRIAVVDLYCDSAEALAKREGTFVVFDPMSPLFRVRDAQTLTTEKQRPVPIPATPVNP